MKTIIFIILITILFLNHSFSQPNITIIGTKDSLTVRDHITQYLNDLDVHEDIYLRVYFSHSLPDGLEGFTNSKKVPEVSNYHLIRVYVKKNLPKSRQMVILAHEMIHVKQYVKGELEVLDNEKLLWKNQQYYYTNSQDENTPWEKEAYNRDNWLARQYKTQSDLPMLVYHNTP